MSQRYAGGLINKSAPVVVGPVDGEGGTASGVWTLEQAGNYIKQGTWPKPIIQGSLFSVGRNTNGTLGQGDQVYRSSPIQVGAETTWSIISCGDVFTQAIKNSNHTLWAWGNNNNGQLGINNITYQLSPTQVGALTTWANLGTGEACTLAVKTDGTLWAWGKNNYGQLGLNNLTSNSSPTQVGALTNWAKASCGFQNISSVAIKTDGTLWSWGGNAYGQLGQNNSTYRSSPVQVGSLTNWSSITVGSNCALATKTDGSLWAIGGDNFRGQLGQNNQVNKSSPVQVGALTTWLNVSTKQYSLIATKTDGTLWSWGRNSNGQLGQNNVDDYSSPTQVGSGTTWSNISNGSVFTLASKSDGTLYSWGANTLGNLGHNDKVARSSPTQIGSLANWSRVSAGTNYFSIFTTK